MADETETGAQIDVVAPEAPTGVPASKKQRAPRRSKAEIEAAASAKTPKARQKRIGKAEVLPISGTTTVAAATQKTVAKGSTNAKPASQQATSPAPLTASDEMADLLQLEEENKTLRQALAEKLRAENADLRKRLGV
ncbi:MULTISPECIES: SyrB-like regulator [unclassified Rhizobium]|uniref:SyrB-like regulator n=1 Tax=unclassified Rhizobium TaxID=2613769 RepID=UPI001ADC0ADE|nr:MULTISPECIES: SyrB-like regulator [unclassified Rhizobium]MBO9101892.1 SyrB-like regulator [Rhizobium sp. L58/93]MBO9172063.1 SyrB-like regulator [Rhizobium sp. L245/93]QXZ88285.1 SyrB-like regulator [Rhizobium sp. K1/93]QXZ94256.1 SyrB-like regulator [Rhizobium sp. K15/93]QYA05654.1 SyrB-like regulator [Rhizobium sp. B21/90]